MKIELVQGDITQVKVDAIVNAANSSLQGGGGVDGAIHKAGGKAILEECQQIRKRQGRCKTGEEVITTAGNLPAKKVIHTVGPIYKMGNAYEEQLLSNCYLNSLLLAKENKLHSIAFPNISTGVYRFPKDLAAQIALKTVRENPLVNKVIFVCFDEENYETYRKNLSE